MAITPVKHIPGEDKKKLPTAKDLVELDIKEAMLRNVTKFQFTGDTYNYKYLPQIVRDTARTITANILTEYITPIMDDLSKTLPDALKSKFRLTFFDSDIKNLIKTTPYIDITTVKNKDGLFDVYAEIIPENLDKLKSDLNGRVRDWLARLTLNYNEKKKA